MKVGVAFTDITPAVGCRLAGHTRHSTGVHDPLFAKAIVFDDAGTRVALVSLDLCTMDLPFVRSAHAAIAAETGIDDVLFRLGRFSRCCPRVQPSRHRFALGPLQSPLPSRPSAPREPSGSQLLLFVMLQNVFVRSTPRRSARSKLFLTFSIYCSFFYFTNASSDMLGRKTS